MPRRGNEYFGSKAYSRVARLVLRRDLYTCAACGSQSDLQVDHIVPRSLGGSVADLDNMQTLCAPCNAIKGASAMSLVQIRVARGLRSPASPSRHWQPSAYAFHKHTGPNGAVCLIGRMIRGQPMLDACPPDCTYNA
jgi:hypothetical protein